MSARRVFFALVAVPLSFAACSEDGASSSTGQQGSTQKTPLPCDVDAFVKTRCAECHGEKPTAGAPMPLVTREDFLAASRSDPTRPVTALLPVRLRDDKKPMPEPGLSFPPRPRATEAELSMIDAWLANGAPARGDGVTCAGGTGGTGGSGAGGAATGGAAGAGGAVSVPDVCTPILLSSAAPWEMPQATTDEYVCFGVEVPNDHKRHITRIAPKVDNAKIVHHLLVFETKNLVSATPKKCKQTLDPSWKLLYAWGPGTQAYELPKEAGFPMGDTPAAGEEGDTTSRFIVQVHYSNIPHAAGEKDHSGVEICASDKLREFDADLVAIGGVDFAIPPHGSLATECTTSIPGPSGAEPMTVFQTWPHMHKLGTKLRTVVTHEDGTTEDLVRVDNYSFDNQIVYPVLPGPMVLKFGDSLKTTCEWSNPSDKKVGWGEDTLDEMCFNFITYYPKRSDYRWNGLAPSYFSKCQSSSP